MRSACRSRASPCGPWISSATRGRSGARSRRLPRANTRPTKTASWRSCSASRTARRSRSRSRPGSRTMTGSRCWRGSRKGTRSSPEAIGRSPRISRTARWSLSTTPRSRPRRRADHLRVDVMKQALDFRESLRIALRAIRANKARGALTTLGIIIGIVAVVLTMTAANGLQNKFRESFASVGTDVIYVSRMPWVVMNDFFLYRNRPNLDLREARGLEDHLRGKAIVNPTMDGREDVKYRDQAMEGVTILGTTDKTSRISSAQPQSGRFLLPFDVTYKKNVCVIGTDVRDGSFGTVDPLGKKIMIGRSVFRVIGVMEKQGGSFLGGPNFDRQIFVPITTYESSFGGSHGRQDVNIAVKAPNQEIVKDLEFETIGEMRKIRNLRP